MGSSKKITVGYKYYLGLHFGLCHGPVDAVQRVIIGDRDAWTGNVTSSQQIAIYNPELFGGKKREGGVVGFLDILMGESTQTENPYLASKLGGAIPSFRGILSAVWNGGHVTSNNPYIKPWAFRVKRILQGWTGGGAWYSAKAEISGSPVFAYSVGGWEYQQIAHHADPGTTNLTIPESGWTPGTGPFGTGVAAPGELVDATRPPNSPWEIKTILWARRTFYLSTSNSYILRVRVENGCAIFINGALVHTINPTNTQVVGVQTVDLTVSGPVLAVTIKAYDEVLPELGGTYLDAEVMILDKSDMNPAHMIYQCLTDTAWGMGYPTDTIDSASFSAAADTLYDENFGLSMVWNQQETIENFISIILNHIGAMLYVKPDTSKFALKLIRNDYDAESLPLYGPETLISATDYQRQAWGETINEVTVVYTDGASGNEASITVQDIANIQTQGGIVAQTVNYSGITSASLAQRVAVRDLYAGSTPLAKIRLTATRAVWQVFPGDVIRLSWPEYEIADVVYRVLQVNRGTLQDGQIIIDAVEDVFGLPENSYLVDQPGIWTDPRTIPDVPPYRKLLEAPYWDLARNLSAGDLAYVDPLTGYVETLVARPAADAINYSIYCRVGAAEFEQQGNSGFCPSATIDGALTKTTTTLTLENGIDLDLVEAGGYAVIDGEYVLVSAIDADAGTATIARGVLDTVPATHADGARIWFADGSQGFDQTEYADGETIDVKLLPATGRGELDIALAPEDSITVDQRQYRPYPPGKLRVNTAVYPETITGTSELAVSWQHRDRLSQTAYIVTQDESSIGPEAATTYTLRIHGESDGLIRTESGLTGTSFTYDAADEQADSGLPVGDSTPIPLADDPAYPKNTIILGFDGTNGSTTFTDFIGNAWTASGNAQLTTTSPLTGTASLLLDGTGDYITGIVTGAIGTGDFTVRAKIRTTSLASDQEVISISDSTGDLNKFNLVFEVKTTGALRGSIQAGASGVVNVDITTATSLIAINTTYDVAFVADGSTARLYIDGVEKQSGTITGTRANQQTYCRIGYLQATYPRYFNGKIDALVVTKGACLYPGGTTYTPPASLTTWNRLSYTSSITTAGANAAQGVASDGTNLWFSNSTTLYKYTEAGSLVTSRSVTGDQPTTKEQINGLFYHAGRLFATAAKFATVGTSWVVEYDPDTLAYVQHWSVTGDWFAEGLAYHNGFWWMVFHANKVIAQLDTSFNVVATHDLSFTITGTSGGYGAGTGYDGIAWYGEHIFCNIHEVYDQAYCDVYGWTGSEFVEVARIQQPTIKANQGIACDQVEADTLWFVERATSGTDGIAKVSIVGAGKWALSNTRLNSRLRIELESVRDGLPSWQHQEHSVMRTGYGYNYGYYYGGV